MFAKLRKRLAEMARPEPVDVSRFNDPVAKQTEWTPVSRGGANFRTHKLVQVRPGRMEFKATLGMRLFALVFLSVGLAAGIGLPFVIAQQADREWFMWLFPLIFGGAFTAAGVFLWRFAAKPRVFDQSAKYFWKGYKSPEVTFGGETSENWVELDRIHALQIVSEYCSGSKGGGYYSYELNLICHDGRRVNVVDHGHQGKMRADAEQLSEFLSVPIWDAS